MNEQEIFEFLKNNLKIIVDSREYSDGSGSYNTIQLWLNNPSTGKTEMISYDSTHG